MPAHWLHTAGCVIFVMPLALAVPVAVAPAPSTCAQDQDDDGEGEAADGHVVASDVSVGATPPVPWPAAPGGQRRPSREIVCDGTETPEGEPVCGPDYVDNFNGGLNSTPPVYSPIACGDAVCGTTGNFVNGGVQSRDTDWYLISLGSQTDVTWSATADGFGHAITTVDISVPGGAVVGEFATSVAGELIDVTNCLAPGDWALFVSTAGFVGVPCGSQYQASVTCGDCLPPPAAACCFVDGSCQELTQMACTNAGGNWQGEGNLCFFIECPEGVCGPGNGDCFSANGTPGCDDEECCLAVCAIDPFCCDTSWDSICAGEALDLCEGAPTNGACCHPDGSCSDEPDEASCTSLGGVFQGVQTSCATVVCPLPPQPNDECDGAIDIGPIPTVVSGSTLGQDPDTAPFCGTSDGSGGGLWYTLTGTGNKITLTTCELQPGGGSANYDTKIRVYCMGCDTLTCVAGNDDQPGCHLQTTVTFCSQAGAEYLVLVHGEPRATRVEIVRFAWWRGEVVVAA